MGSDHYPIVTEIEQKFTFNDYAHVPKWKLDKADWHQFRTILKHVLGKSPSRIVPDQTYDCTQSWYPENNGFRYRLLSPS